MKNWPQTLFKKFGDRFLTVGYHFSYAPENFAFFILKEEFHFH